MLQKVGVKVAIGSGPKKGKRAKAGIKSPPKGKVRKEFWLDPRLLRESQDYLGASSECEAVEMALDLVVFSKELARGARTLRKLSLSRID
jgi:hypothetical protein